MQWLCEGVPVNIRRVVWPVPRPGDGNCDALSLEIRRAGQRMEHAMHAGQRDLAVVWMQTMYGLIRVRRDGLVNIRGEVSGD